MTDREKKNRKTKEIGGLIWVLNYHGLNKTEENIEQVALLEGVWQKQCFQWRFMKTSITSCCQITSVICKDLLLPTYHNLSMLINVFLLTLLGSHSRVLPCLVSTPEDGQTDLKIYLVLIPVNLEIPRGDAIVHFDTQTRLCWRTNACCTSIVMMHWSFRRCNIIYPLNSCVFDQIYNDRRPIDDITTLNCMLVLAPQKRWVLGPKI